MPIRVNKNVALGKNLNINNNRAVFIPDNSVIKYLGLCFFYKIPKWIVGVAEHMGMAGILPLYYEIIWFEFTGLNQH